MISIAQHNPEYTATAARLDAQAAERGQERADADDGWAYYNAMTLKWMQQGYTAAELGIDPATVNFWTEHHAAGYRAFHAGYQLQLFEAGAPATYRQEAQ